MTSTRTSKLILGIGVAVLTLVAAVTAALVSADDDGAPSDAGEVGRIVDPEDNPLLAPPDAAAGSPAPTAAYEWFDGTEATLARYRGTPLVLNFFGSWCPPCVAEMPAIEAVHQQFGDSVAFLGLAVRDAVADAQEIIEQTGVTYDVGRDVSTELFAELRIVRMPSTVFISADGQVLDVHGGELSRDELAAKVEELLL